MKKFLILLLVFILSGCGLHTGPSVKKAPVYENYGEGYFDVPSEEGSLWQGENSGLFADGQARKVGDTIIVDIVENTNSEIKATTSLTKETELDVKIPNAFGYMSHLSGIFPRLKPDSLLKAETKNEFDGSGKSDRNATLKGSVGARVIKVLPNGDLVVSGRKDVKINNETQIIKVSGIVRSKDIGSDNRVESTYLANADIEITGEGIITDKQRPGWMARVIDNVWPF